MNSTNPLKAFLLLLLFIPAVLLADTSLPPSVTTLEAGMSPRGLAAGDVFGNGTLDLLVANFGSPTFIGQSTPASRRLATPHKGRKMRVRCSVPCRFSAHPELLQLGTRMTADQGPLRGE